MEREQERERRRLRDRERRQSMTQEQRERHLARRRRNYHLRRQRVANVPFIPLLQGPDLRNCDTSSFNELQWFPPSTSSDNIVICHGLNHGHETSEIVEGSSIQVEGLPRRLRLNKIKRLARNLTSESTGNYRIAENLLAKGDVLSGDGCTPKPLRLNRVKRLARSISFPSKETAAWKNYNGTVGATNC